MSVVIHKLNKILLEEMASLDMTMSNSASMTISHLAGAVKSASVELPYLIEGVDTHVPEIADVEFCVVSREKVDLTATGVNENIKKNIGEDVGEYKHTDNVPPPPSDLPPGFTEIYSNK